MSSGAFALISQHLTVALLVNIAQELIAQITEPASLHLNLDSAFISLQHGEGYFTSLCLNFPIYNIGMIIITSGF